MEPGTKKPTLDPEDCWATPCPVPYCGAQVNVPCMNPKGLFALNTHLRRREQFLRPSADHFGRDRPRSELQERVRFQEHPERTEFFQDIPAGWVSTDRKRDKITLEDEDFDPWWDDEEDF